MPKGPQGQMRPADVIVNPVHIVQIATGEAQEIALSQPARRNSGLTRARACMDTQPKFSARRLRKRLQARGGGDAIFREARCKLFFAARF